MPVTPHVRLATHADLDGIVALETRYFVGHLSPADLAEGFISILHPPEWFDRAVDAGGVHVAIGPNGEVVGFIVVSAPPDPAAAGGSPIIQAMCELAETLEFNGVPIARQRYAFRGPVCIAAEARGSGVYSAFNAVTLAAYRDQFDLGLLFVSADNQRSLHTTTSKLGAHSLAEFEADGRRFRFLVFEFGAGADRLPRL